MVGVFEKAKWIWNGQTDGMDCYAEFITRYEFEEYDKVSLRISVDSNYAVYVNGSFVDSGQYGDYPYYKVYDEIDLSKYIVSGENYIAFIVWHYGHPFFNYCVSKPGLLFEIERNNQIVLSSDEDIMSRKSRQYISGRSELITMQLGFNFHVDLTQGNEWMTGEDDTGFEPSVLVNEMPDKLYPRGLKKLEIRPRTDSVMTSQGTFTYRLTDAHFGAKMQNAALTYLKDARVQDGENDDGIYYIVDLKSEVAGYLDFDIEVDEECQMEIGWGEHLVDGRCRTSIGTRNYSVTVNLKKGRNSYMNPFRRFGCRYLQLFIHTKQAIIRYAGVRPTVYPLKVKTFRSGNVLRDKIYEVCQNTLIHCMHEHYEDCPWREQSLYTMDSRNQMLCTYYAFSEFEFVRENLLLMSKGIRDDGMLTICFPTDYKLTIPSFTLAYIIQTAEYYRYSKDADTIKACFSSAKKIVDMFLERVDETGLIPNFDEAQEYWNFYEWKRGLNGHTYKGKAYDLCLNALLSLVVEYFAEMCAVVDMDAKPYLSKKKDLNRRIVELFWDEDKELFRTCIGHDIPFSVLGNAWVYLCGATEGLNTEKLLMTIADNGVGNEDEVIPSTLSMNTFRYEALLKADKELYRDFILDEIDRTYLKMLMGGATSFWETMEGEKDFSGAGSLCHGWSAMPIYYYELLGKKD